MARQAASNTSQASSTDDEKNKLAQKILSPSFSPPPNLRREEKVSSRPSSNVSRQSHHSTLVGSKTAGTAKEENRPRTSESADRIKKEEETSVVEQQWKLRDDLSDTSSTLNRKNIQKKT